MKYFLILSIAIFLLVACSQNRENAAVVADSAKSNSAAAPEGTVIPAGADTSVKITEAYARLVAKDAYFWAWPLVNMYNRRMAFKDVKELALAGPLIMAPLNRFAMLTDYVIPTERAIACPNQDVVYGIGCLALDQTPVVIQVPDFGDRFWVYQIVDLRTDGFAQLGKMYDAKPGFYLLAGPDWNGNIPQGITKVFRSSTNTGLVGPRVFMDDTPEDRKAIQEVLKSVVMYPLEEFDGKMKTIAWADIKKLPGGDGGKEEAVWVKPETFFDELPTVLNDARPLPGEEARYSQVLAVISAARKNPDLKKALISAATEADQQVIKPLMEFRNWGIQLPHHWSSVKNGASWGTDYFTRTAVAKSNILVNNPNETRYFYQDLDSSGKRLNNGNRYTLTFAKDALPPVNGFWSLTLYNQHHFFEINKLNRYSLGTKNKSMKKNDDGSLTIYVQANPPAEEWQSNWLPAVEKGDFSLYLRTYWPKETVVNGTWSPPAVVRIK
ncbi:DUF1254 domain-containing protein [Pollutibacter soli]|uniref:DUF1254 domain-containing protein n=1 Tax=Pollutibacter soli TaxID=3034157 RepID=UPI003013E95E